MTFLYTPRQILLCFIALLLALPTAAQGTYTPIAAQASVATSELAFSFYGQPLHAARLNTVKVKSVRNHDVNQAWCTYQKNGADAVVTSLRSTADELGLNDWFMFELVRKYVDELLATSSPMDRVLLEHFLLVSMGYDVRLARTEQQLLLLVPFEQEVYERCFIKIKGKDYYLFFDNLDANQSERSVIYPCDPIKDDGTRQAFNLLFEGKTLNVQSDEEKMCDLDDGQIHLACAINPNVIKMLSDYPLMDVQCYATSVVLPQFHQTISEQLEPQLEDMSQCEAANALLHFVQHVFGYNQDRDLHGRYKVNFVEENFYYDENDCEDRSILYAVLVHSLLGLDVHFVEYPDHECTAVHFTDCFTRGYGYDYNGDFYLICDPTYIGADIGRCMPKYRAMRPAIKSMGTTTMNANSKTALEPVIDQAVLRPNHAVALTSFPTVELPTEPATDITE